MVTGGVNVGLGRSLSYARDEVDLIGSGSRLGEVLAPSGHDSVHVFTRASLS